MEKGRVKKYNNINRIKMKNVDSLFSNIRYLYVQSFAEHRVFSHFSQAWENIKITNSSISLE